MTVYAAPGTDGSSVSVLAQYGNFIGGEFREPASGAYMDDVTPVTGQLITRVARSDERDVEAALDAAHAAAASWNLSTPTERAAVLNHVADLIDAHREELAIAETWDNGKPVRETLAADIPLAADHFRYFAAAARTLEGSVDVIDHDTVAYHFHEPLGVVAQIIPFNFPLLMAAWKIAPALAAGNCTVVKPASPTPWSILKLMEIIGEAVPKGVVNVITGPGAQVGKALATSNRIAKIGFTGETVTGRTMMQYAAENLIPVTLELGGKSPNIFFADVMDHEDGFLDKALEGVAMFAFNKGEVCTCPSRALIQESIYDRFVERVLDKMAKVVQGYSLDTDTMIGPQVSQAQIDKVARYVQIGRDEGCEVLCGGAPANLPAPLDTGYYYQPTLLRGTNSMRVFQEEIFGPVLAVTTFTDEADALAIANDTVYGLGAGVWSRNGNLAYRMGRGIKAGRVWTNCYHRYPAGAAFGGYKISGIGRENHKMMLEHYSQTKNLLVGYDEQPVGLF